MARRRNKGGEKRIARDRIRRLLQLAASEALGPDADLADRYALLARRISMRYQVPFSPAQKMCLCKSCNAFRIPGRNTRTRIRQGQLVTTCTCGHSTRRPLPATATATTRQESS